MYCTLSEARTAGAYGSDTAVTDAILQAQARVDSFTGDLFEPAVRTVVVTVSPDGRGFLPYRLNAAKTITSVVDNDTDVTLDPGTYRAYTSAVDGDVDALGFGRDWVGSNVLINGLEPWAPRRSGPRRVRVTASFGWEAPPTAVEMATAHLAALIAREMVPDDDNNPATPQPATAAVVDPEGNVIPVVPPFAGEAEDEQVLQLRTTGSRRADSLLVPYRRLRLFSAV